MVSQWKMLIFSKLSHLYITAILFQVTVISTLHITILCAKPHFISIFFNKYRHLGMRVAFIVIEVKCDSVGGTQIVATKIL